MSANLKIEEGPRRVLEPETEKPYFSVLKNFLLAERNVYTCYPPET